MLIKGDRIDFPLLLVFQASSHEAIHFGPRVLIRLLTRRGRGNARFRDREIDFYFGDSSR